MKLDNLSAVELVERMIEDAEQGRMAAQADHELDRNAYSAMELAFYRQLSVWLEEWQAGLDQ